MTQDTNPNHHHMDFDWETLTLHRHNDVGGGSPTIHDHIYLLRPGDRVLWNDRKQPLDIADTSEERERVYESGCRESCVVAESASGAKYGIGVWWHFEDDYDPRSEIHPRNRDDWRQRVDLDRSTGVHPQAHRCTDGSWDRPEYFERLSSDAPITKLAQTDLPKCLTSDLVGADIVYTLPAADRNLHGRVTGVRDRVGVVKLVVEPTSPDAFIPSEHTLSPKHVIMYRLTEDGGGE